MNSGKPFWKSKTVWVNTLTMLLSLLTMLAGSEYIDPKIVAIITGIAIPIVNVILRFITKEPIEGPGGKPIVVLAFCLAAFGIAASAIADILLVTDAGYFLLKQDDSGVPYVEQLNNVIDLRGDGGPQPNPPGPNPPNPNPPSPPNPYLKLTQTVSREAAKVNDATTQKALAKVYEMVADRVESGDLDYSRAFEAVSAASDAVLKETGGLDKWAAWRSSVSDELTRLRQQGKLGSQREMVQALRAIQAGLDNQALGDRVDLEKLVELIELILKILLAFK